MGVPWALAILLSCNASLAGSFLPPDDVAISLTGIQTLVILFTNSSVGAVTTQIAGVLAPFLVFPLFLLAFAELVAKNWALRKVVGIYLGEGGESTKKDAYTVMSSVT